MVTENDMGLIASLSQKPVDSSKGKSQEKPGEKSGEWKNPFAFGSGKDAVAPAAPTPEEMSADKAALARTPRTMDTPSGQLPDKKARPTQDWLNKIGGMFGGGGAMGA